MARNRHLHAALAIAASILFGVPQHAAAQQTVSDVLTFLMTNQSVPTGNAQWDLDAAKSSSDTIARALVASLATLPVTSSSGAFVYRLNPELGTVQRATETFGPFFVERAQTIGRRQAAFAVTFQHLRFTTLDGYNLRDGSLVTTANQFRDEQVPFDVDRLTLHVDADVVTANANIGLTDRMEVGVALPIVSLRLDGTRVDTYRGRAFTQATASAATTGLADMVLRTKYTIFGTHGGAVAAAVDVRLPTGRSDNLLGAGSPSARLAGIASFESGRVSVHANGGISVGGLAREVGYGGAMAVAAHTKLTIIAEMIGRRLDGPGRIAPLTAANAGIAGVDTIRLSSVAGPLNIVTMSPGVKWNLTDTWVLGAHVSVPLTDAGLTSPFTPFVGLDYAFGR